MIVKQEMYRRIMRRILPALIFCVSSACAAEALRTFTDTQNRTFDGVLKAYNATNQVVTIRRSDGRGGEVPLSVFSEADRRYIRNWGITNDFMQGVKLAVQQESADLEGGSVPAGGRVIKDFHYRVHLRNQSTSSFKGITVEYCIYYRQGERGGSTVRYDEGICYGKEKVASLQPASSKHFETRQVRLYSESGVTTLFGVADNLSSADIRGIWLRLKMKAPSGRVIEREYRSADDEMWKWTPCSIGVGMNERSVGGGLFILE